MDEYIKAVSTVGFPIAMTVYLLVRFEKNMGAELRNMGTEIRTLRDAVNRLSAVLARRGIHLDNE